MHIPGQPASRLVSVVLATSGVVTAGSRLHSSVLCSTDLQRIWKTNQCARFWVIILQLDQQIADRLNTNTI